jgi:enoyl-CoA hydratase/carnithine racemase
MTFTNLEISEPGDGIVMIRLAAPSDGTNRLTMSFVKELHAATDQIRDKGGVRLLVFTGKGRVFSAGADLAEIRDAGPEDIRSFLSAGQALMRLIMELNLLTVAAVNGLALGGGLELALSCDIRWAHRRAVFGLPEAKLGLLPGWGGIPLVGRNVAESFWVEMVAGGDFVTARRAYEAGLVSRLFEGADFEGAVLGELRKIAGRGEKVLREVKNQVKLGRGNVDLAACDEPFQTLWNERDRG